MRAKDLMRWRRLLFLPVMVVAVLVLGFWWMWMGDDSADRVKTGLNMQLPGVGSFRDSMKDKMGFYISARMDSVKRKELEQMDPYRRDSVSADYRLKLPRYQGHADRGQANEIAVKIAAIQQRIAESKKEVSGVGFERREEVRSAVAQKPVVIDAEMEAINGTLDKLLEVQRPKKSLEASTENKNAMMVSAGEEKDTTFFGRRRAGEQRPHFLNDGVTHPTIQNTISAVVPLEETVTDGGIVKLELRTGIVVGGITISVGTNLFGVASLSGSRLQVHINTIRYQDHLLPVSLGVYDLDGLEGINVPGSITRDVAKASANQGIQSIGISGYSGSIAGQATVAGIGAAKSLLSKKVKQVSITLSAGYAVILKEQH